MSINAGLRFIYLFGRYSRVTGRYENPAERRILAGKRTLAGQDLLDFGLLVHLERVVYLNPEVTHCTFKFRMA